MTWQEEINLPMFRRIREEVVRRKRHPMLFFAIASIEIIEGSNPPTPIIFSSEESRTYENGKTFRWCTKITVGREWIKQNATDEELAEFIAAKMLK